MGQDLILHVKDLSAEILPIDLTAWGGNPNNQLITEETSFVHQLTHLDIAT